MPEAGLRRELLARVIHRRKPPRRSRLPRRSPRPSLAKIVRHDKPTEDTEEVEKAITVRASGATIYLQRTGLRTARRSAEREPHPMSGDDPVQPNQKQRYCDSVVGG